MEKDYKAKVEKVIGRKMDIKERIAIKRFEDATPLYASLLINIDSIACVSVHNEHVKEGENTDYMVYVIVDSDGGKYKTSSESFIKSIEDISDDLTDAGIEQYPMTIKVCETKSKNNQGSFFTAVLV